ncbi:MAG TPA: hypothetical protein VIQ77_09080 [Mucilaginibacter sp.]
MQCKSTLKSIAMAALACGVLVNSGYTTRYSIGATQMDVVDLLNVRPVTTLTGGKLVHWTKGVDRENGYLTASAAKFNGEADSKALPDNPMIPADNHHPEILLNYKNDDATGYQARLLDTDTFTFQTFTGKYGDLYICLTSAYGKSELQCTLLYNDLTEQRNVTVPDWANDVPDNDPDFCYVVHDLPKWSNTGKQTEPNHHNIHALNLHPNPTHVLKSVSIKNLSKTYLLFWAATGY